MIYFSVLKRVIPNFEIMKINRLSLGNLAKPRPTLMSVKFCNLSKLAVNCFELFFKASQLSNKPDLVIGLIFLCALYVHASNKTTKDHHKTSYSA